jgi:hypothetical protein
VKRLPFKSSRITGISVAVIAQRTAQEISPRRPNGPREENASCTSAGTMPIS